MTDDEKAALRLTAAREFLKCLEPIGEGNEHEKLSAAFAAILAVAGPPVDYSCAAFAIVASILRGMKGGASTCTLWRREGSISTAATVRWRLSPNSRTTISSPRPSRRFNETRNLSDCTGDLFADAGAGVGSIEPP